MDQQLKSSINNAEEERKELEKKLVVDKAEFEKKIKDSTANLENVRSKVKELIVELENKNNYLNELKTELHELEAVSDKSSQNLIALQDEYQKLSLDTTEKEGILFTLNKELETFTD